MGKAQGLEELPKVELDDIWDFDDEGRLKQPEESKENKSTESAIENSLDNEPEYDKLLAEYNKLQAAYDTLNSSHNELNQKYKSYDGTYGRITGENTSLKERISQLENEIGRLSQQATMPTNTDYKKSVKYQKWEELYGEEIAKEMMEETRETVRQAIDENITPIKNEWKKEKEDIEAIQQNAFNTNLRVVIPDFDTVNSSIEFDTWLKGIHTIKDEFDNDISVANKDIGERAMMNRDVKAISNLINRFKRETAKPASSTSTKPLIVAPKASGGAYIPPQTQEINLTLGQQRAWWAAYQKGESTGYTPQQDDIIFEKYPAPGKY